MYPDGESVLMPMPQAIVFLFNLTSVSRFFLVVRSQWKLFWASLDAAPFTMQRIEQNRSDRRLAALECVMQSNGEGGAVWRCDEHPRLDRKRGIRRPPIKVARRWQAAHWKAALFASQWWMAFMHKGGAAAGLGPNENAVQYRSWDFRTPRQRGETMGKSENRHSCFG